MNNTIVTILIVLGVFLGVSFLWHMLTNRGEPPPGYSGGSIGSIGKNSISTNFLNSLCTPAKVYALFIGLSLFLALFNGIPILVILVNLIFSVIWIKILNYICGKGYSWFSWVLVLLPFVFLFSDVSNILKTMY